VNVITFTTSGYTGDADVYYAAVTVAGGTTAAPTQYSDYTLLGTFKTGTHEEIEIVAAADTDVYVAVSKDGMLSNIYKIPTYLAANWEPSTFFADVDAAANTPSIKGKFGITTEGTAGVKETVRTLHYFIQAGGLTDDATKEVIKLGDWIDLESLSVAAYNGAGGFTATANPQLIVAGINSFRSGTGSYAETVNDGVDHVVFHFQNMPVLRRMNAAATNAGGYAESEMRKYLTTVEDDADSGKFLAGLVAAGVPKSVMWAPLRHVATGNDAGDGTKVKDLLWLPTVREMFESTDGYASTYETEGNQAWLEYYSSNDRRKKAAPTGEEVTYYLGSAAFSKDPDLFATVLSDGNPTYTAANNEAGCVPAFCIN
jgi:hypothetical protein